MKQLFWKLVSPTWRKLSLLVGILFLTAMYVFIFPSPTLTYVAAVLAHAGIGTVAALFLIPKLREIFSVRNLRQRAGWLLIVAGAGLGVALLFIGTARPKWNWMYAHIAVSLAGTAVLIAHWAGSRGWLSRSNLGRSIRYAGFLAMAAGLGIGGWQIRQGRWLSTHRIENPPKAPDSMN